MVIGLNIIVGCELTFSHANYDEYLDKVEKIKLTQPYSFDYD